MSIESIGNPQSLIGNINSSIIYLNSTPIDITIENVHIIGSIVNRNDI